MGKINKEVKKKKKETERKTRVRLRNKKKKKTLKPLFYIYSERKRIAIKNARFHLTYYGIYL